VCSSDLDEDEMLLAFERFIILGYEGLMVRNAAGLYVNKRSTDLQKVKQFTDDDYEIVDIVEGKGKLSGHGIFVCVTKTGVRFEAKMVGDLTALKAYYERPKAYIGRMLVVKHQGITNANKVPRFPVALRLAEDL
jgi:DNA ligase-1